MFALVYISLCRFVPVVICLSVFMSGSLCLLKRGAFSHTMLIALLRLPEHRQIPVPIPGVSCPGILGLGY